MKTQTLPQIPKRVPVRDALQALAAARTDDTVVVTNQGSSRVWPLIGEHPLNFHYNPSTMGGAIPLSLGIALAQPDRPVVCVSGDGSLLMNLGSLVTTVAAQADNLTIILLDNGVYEITGGQKTPASELPIDYCQLAQSVGFTSIGHYLSMKQWKTEAAACLAAPGPCLVWLEVDRAEPDDLATKNEPIEQQLKRLQRTLQV